MNIKYYWFFRNSISPRISKFLIKYKVKNQFTHLLYCITRRDSIIQGFKLWFGYELPTPVINNQYGRRRT
jgi:hypothetical protein